MSTFWQIKLSFILAFHCNLHELTKAQHDNSCCGINQTLVYYSDNDFGCSETSAGRRGRIFEKKRDFGEQLGCSKYKVLTNEFDTAFEIQSNGEVEIGMKPILHSQYPTKIQFSEDSYCTNNGTSLHLHQIPILIYCPNDDFDKIIRHRKIHAGLEFTKAFILSFGGIIYLILWKQQTISGWAQFSCFISYGLHFFFSSAHILAYIDPTDTRPSGSCLFMGLFYEFTMRATDTTWLVVNMDLSRLTWNVRQQSLATISCRKKNYYKERALWTPRFVTYLSIGWLLPIASVAADFCRRYFTLSEERDRESFSLGYHSYGHERCLPKFDMALFSAQIVFQVFNFVLYIATLVVIIRNSRRNKAASKLLDTPAQLYIRLIIFTGTVLLPTKILQKVLKLSIEFIWVWIVTRVYDIILCLYIAKVFAFKEDHISLLQERYLWFQRIWCITPKIQNNHNLSDNYSRTNTTKTQNVPELNTVPNFETTNISAV